MKVSMETRRCCHVVPRRSDGNVDHVLSPSEIHVELKISNANSSEACATLTHCVTHESSLMTDAVLFLTRCIGENEDVQIEQQHQATDSQFNACMGSHCGSAFHVLML